MVLDPTTHRVVATREVVGEVGVEALHAGPRAAHAAGRARTPVSRVDRCIAFAAVRVVGPLELDPVDLGLGPMDPTGRLEPADQPPEVGIDQPVPSRHRPAVVEDRCVPQDRRCPVGGSDDDLEGALRRPTEQALDLGEVVRIHPSPVGDAGDVRGRG